MARPPKVPREERIVKARIFVAQQIVKSGAPPSVRKLADAIGYADSSTRSYEAVRKLTDDDRVIYIETDWQNFLFPVEVYDAMREAALLVLEKEGVTP